MHRKYKLLLIISISILLAYFIYIFNIEDKVYLVALGDGVSSGETSYNIDGISYNDYIKEYFDSKNILKKYNKDFSKKNYKIKELLDDLDNNVFNDNKSLYIKQVIHKGNIITLCIGEEELTKLSITNDLSENRIKEFINNYDTLLEKLKKITDGKVYVVGLYENNYLDNTTIIIINSELANLVKKYEYIFINITDLLLNKGYYLTSNSYYFNYKAHKLISDMIINSM